MNRLDPAGPWLPAVIEPVVKPQAPISRGKKGERLKKAALIAWRKYVKAKQPAPKAAAA